MAPSNDDSLKQKAEKSLDSNPSALGDPVSLKAEKSDTKPTEKDKPKDDKPKDSQDGQHKSLKQVAQESNPSMLGDPVSLKAETSNTEPTEDDRGASKTERSKKRDSKI